ncbi:aldo/keto reductase [Amycolatopsis orientalis]|uniref:Aldo/keto reductase n=1 Tax=Amycolatopsis orientalis TaxID=31958 RepID=A0A193BUN1_AMYOR|nr:aldo/keto reductase [Amycolatopsis orientalis]ANN15888.1 aldo/keto reductase [Amycolatopsis orientalis]
MKRRELGHSGLKISRMGLGTATWGLTTDRDEAAKQLEEFVGAGGDLVDSSDVYGEGASERVIGELLGAVVPRSSVVLATKSGGVAGGKPGDADTRRESLLSALDASLTRLRTDYVDLWQMHVWDDRTPIDETMSAIETAVQSGRVRHAGICNYAGWQTALAARKRLGGGPSLVSTQVEYSLLERGAEREVVPAAAALGLGVLPWAPLGRGVLTAKYRSGVPQERTKSSFFRWYVGHHLNAPRTGEIVDTVASAAAELDVAPVAIALAWVRDRPSVVAPVVGARTVEQLRDSLTAESLELPEEIRTRLDEVSTPYIGYPERLV